MPLAVVPLDLNKNELRNALLHLLAVAPGAPVEGLHYYDTVAHRWLYYDGAAFKNVATDSDKLQGNDSAFHRARANATGTQLAATISDFAAAVMLIRLDQMALPTADLNLNARKITNLADPTGAQDAVTKAYADAIANGLDVKASCRLATAAALPANTRTGNVLDANANGAMPNIDGVAPAINDSILVKDEGTGSKNGIYTVTSLGSGGTKWQLTRRADADVSAEVTSGMFTFIEEGTTNDNTGWILTTNNPIVLNTDALSFTKFSSAAALTAGAGLVQTGNAFDVVSNHAFLVVNADNIDIGTLPVNKGGTGATTAAGAKTNLGFTTVFSQTIGDAAATSFNIDHNFGTRDVHVHVYDAATFAEIICNITHSTINRVVIDFAVAPAANAYRVVVIG